MLSEAYKVKKDQKIPVRDGFIIRVKEDTPGSEFYNKYLEGLTNNTNF